MYSIMSDGEVIEKAINGGKLPKVPGFAKLHDFVTTTNNQGVIKEYFQNRFGHKQATANPAIPVEKSNPPEKR